MTAALEVTVSDLVVHIDARPEATLVTIAGEIDIASAPQLRTHLHAVPLGDMILDLCALRFLDAAGLSVLLELRARLDRAGARMVLAAVPGAAQRVITIAGLHQLFTTAHTVDAAVALLARSCTNGHRGLSSGPRMLPRERLP